MFPENLPDEFHPEELLEKGKNPGLGIEQLHEQGITGKGINIAIIDQPLLTAHENIKDNIQLYELYKSESSTASMSGSSVASIAVGKNTGVAPDAKLYYIASTFLKVEDGKYVSDNSIIIDGIKRVLEINKKLDDSDKIKVVSIGLGFVPDSENYQEIINIIEVAKKEGVFVITPSLEVNYNVRLMGLDRDMNKNLDDETSYTWSKASMKEDFFFNQDEQNTSYINVPMDSITYSGFLADDNYIYSSYGGISMTCPWLAGMYALCLQVDPDLTPIEFLQTAIETGTSVSVPVNGKEYNLSKIINPIGIINHLKNK